MSRPVPPRLPEGMRRATWDAVCELPDYPTASHPLGLRTAVLERAAIIQEATGCTWPEADAAALEQELPQRRLAGVG